MSKLTLDQLNRVDVDTFKKLDKKPVVVILDNVRSALNVGSIFRTADAFAIQEIALCGITATPPNREITKTAIGATESVTWKYFESTFASIEYYKGQGFAIFAVEQTTDSISLLDFKSNVEGLCLIFGNEVDGVEASILPLCDGCIEIPQHGTKHSLNVSVCAGIVLWQVTLLK
jgi:23S rRNA (guanosine2251-2'-O)-methyltransferase